MTEPIRLVIADDHMVVREGLRLIFETGTDFAVVGEAADGAEALEVVRELQPDVVLMDLRMPRLDGTTAIQRLRTENPDVAVVILTTYNEDELMIRALRAGARGYLLKDTGREALFRTVRAAARGTLLLQPDILDRVLAYTDTPTLPRAAAGSAVRRDVLTERERQVLQGIVQGERSRAIAARLHITERTVKAHLASIYSKLGVDSRAAAVAAALSGDRLAE